MKRNVQKALIGVWGILLSLLITTAAWPQATDSIEYRARETKKIYSKILKEERTVTVQLPLDRSPYDVFPVLYLLDGEAFNTMVGGQVQYLSEVYKILPKLIIVAIENTDRTRDLTPTHSLIGLDGKNDTSINAFGKRSGGGENFLRFIKEELMPFVESHYPTAPYKILSGHSLGGLMSVYCLLHHPEYFNSYIAISPSLQWDNANILAKAAYKLAGNKFNNRILFFCDANEDALFHQNQLTLDSILKVKDIEGLTYKRTFYPEETHLSEPVKAFYDGIRTVYPDWHLPYNSSAFRKTMTSKIIIEHYNELSKKYGYKVVPLHDEINQISRFLRNDSSRIKDAIDLLEMNAINYPTSALVQETLGDTYLKMNAPEKALTCFEEALKLDKTNKRLKQKIEAINN